MHFASFIFHAIRIECEVFFRWLSYWKHSARFPLKIRVFILNIDVLKGWKIFFGTFPLEIFISDEQKNLEDLALSQYVNIPKRWKKHWLWQRMLSWIRSLRVTKFFLYLIFLRFYFLLCRPYQISFLAAMTTHAWQTAI